MISLRPRSEHRAELDLTPFMDVIFILLIFFIIASKSDKGGKGGNGGRRIYTGPIITIGNDFGPWGSPRSGGSFGGGFGGGSFGGGGAGSKL